MTLDLLPADLRSSYEVHEWRHACAILSQDFPEEWDDIIDVLARFRLKRSWLTSPGGRKSPISSWIDSEITRCDQLQAIFDQLGRGSSYGASTTHMSKLLPRIRGGGGAGCPLLVFGITDQLYDESL